MYVPDNFKFYFSQISFEVGRIDFRNVLNRYMLFSIFCINDSIAKFGGT